MTKLQVAKIVQKLFAVVAILIALSVVWFFGWLLVQWAIAHFTSFFWCMLVVGIVGVLFGGLAAMDWSDKVIEEAEKEEKAELKRIAKEKEHQETARKLKEYREKWGKDATPPVNYNGDYYWNEAPVGAASRARVDRV